MHNKTDNEAIIVNCNYAKSIPQCFIFQYVTELLDCMTCQPGMADPSLKQRKGLGTSAYRTHISYKTLQATKHLMHLRAPSSIQLTALPLMTNCIT